MNKKRQITGLGGAILVAGVLATQFASSALAQGQSQPSGQGRGADFQRLDQDGDDLLVWRELDAALGPRLVALGMDEQLVMTIFDEDGDSALDVEEFGRFQQGVRQAGEQLRSRRANTSETQQPANRSTAAEGARDGESQGRRTLGGGNVKLSSEELEKAIIERSFDRDVRSEKVSKVQAGSSVFSEAEEPAKVRATPKAATGAQRDGTAVIVVDGQVIASTAVANPEPSRGDAPQSDAPQSDAPQSDAPQSDDRSTVDADDEQAAAENRKNSTTLEANDPRSIYAGLRNTPVVNMSGESIGVIEGLVVNSDTGKAGLVVNVGGVTSIGGAKVLAPLTSVAVTAENVVWQTAQALEELIQSNPYEPAGYIEITPNQ